MGLKRIVAAYFTLVSMVFWGSIHGKHWFGMIILMAMIWVVLDV